MEIEQTFSSASTEKIIQRTEGSGDATGISFGQMHEKLFGLENKPGRRRGGGFNDAQSEAMTIYAGHGNDDGGDVDMKSLKSKRSRKSGKGGKKKHKNQM